MTILNKFQQIFADTNKWSYYNSVHSGNYPFLNERSATRFIFEYFKRGGKERVFDNLFNDVNVRNIHSTSTFFLGLMIEPLLFVRSGNKTQAMTTDEPDFNYFWFLTCLYHDYGYFVEYQKSKYPPQKFDLKRICKKLKIENNLLETEHILNFERETIKKYYNYCQTELNFVNHGIIGGLLLYDRLKKNYAINKQDARNEGVDGVDNDNFEYKGLHWSIDHETYYAKVADIIVSHNIWFSIVTDKKTCLIYNKYGLDKLIIEKRQRQNCSNSLLALLSLCDTIEPIKSFSPLNPECILNNLDITIDSISKTISITVLDSCINSDYYFKNIRDLEKWLNVEVTEIGDTIRIKIND